MNYLALTLVALTLAGSQPAPPAATEREAKQIETMLIAPCCWTAQVSQHQSEASLQVKGEIREMLAAGRTRQQVLDAFVVRYGERILAEPPARGFGRLLYVALPLAFVLSGALLVVFVRRASRSGAPAAAAGGEAAGSTGDDRYAAQLDDELRDMD
jgi:cytochrome c-type biogenesis protein CcmH